MDKSGANKKPSFGEKGINTVRWILNRLLLSDNFVLYLCVLFFLALLPFVPRMGSLGNLGQISSNMWPLLALVIGQMFVLILGGIDLSQTSIMAITSVIGALIMTSELDPNLFQNNPLWGVVLSENGGPLAGSILAVPMAVLAMLIVGSLIGLLNGLAVARFKMPPFMVTLISMMFFSGLAIYITRSENVIHLPTGYIAIGNDKLWFIPYSFFVAGLLTVTAHLILTRTLLGRWFYAVGKNIRTSMISGIPVSRVLILGYVFSGFCAAAGSILYSARLGGGRPTLGQTQLLDVIAAAVIGGISLFGGKGKVLWAVFGVLFFTLLSNALDMLNLSFYTVNIVKGSVIIMAALIDVARNKILSQTKI